MWYCYNVFRGYVPTLLFSWFNWFYGLGTITLRLLDLTPLHNSRLSGNLRRIINCYSLVPFVFNPYQMRFTRSALGWLLYNGTAITDVYPIVIVSCLETSQQQYSKMNGLEMVSFFWIINDKRDVHVLQWCNVLLLLILLGVCSEISNKG